MRIMFSTCPAHGHLFPAVPLAWALRNAGHDVLLPLPERMVDAGHDTGLAVARTTDVDMMGILAKTFQPLLSKGIANASDEDRMRYGVLGFARLAEAVAPGLVDTARAWEPDLVVHDAVDFAGPLAAAHVAAPTIAYGWGTWLPPATEAAVVEAVRPLYERFDRAEPDLTPAARVDVCPPALSGGGPEGVVHLRFVPYNGAGELPPWLLAPKPATRILVTFGGSVGDQASRLGAPLLARVLDGLQGIEAEIVIAAKSDEDARGLKNVRSHPWLPLNYTLPSCDLVIHHGGSGTSLSAAAYAVPQLVLPQLADQFRFAAAIQRSGAGEQLLPHLATAEAIAEAIRRLLRSNQVACQADQISNEIAELPSVSTLAVLAERVVELGEPASAANGGRASR